MTSIIISDFELGAKYTEAMSPVTEAPASFHYASLLTVVGALLKRKVWIPYSQRLYPNLYTCLIGASGLTRKTTSIRLAVEMFPKLSLLKGLSSFEGLLLKMKDSPSVLVVLEEFSAFLLKVKKQDAISSMLPKLAELYDNPSVVDLPTRKDPIVVRSPNLSIITATTPEWLEQSLQFEDIMGGLGNRFMFVFGETSTPVMLPSVPDYAEIPKRILERVNRFKDETMLSLDSEAEEVWKIAYRRWYEQQKKQDEIRRILDVRMPGLALKIAMIVHVLEGKGKNIAYRHLIGALEFVEAIRGYLDELRPLFSPVEYKVLKIIEKEGEIRRSRLHQMIGGRIKSMDLHNSIMLLAKFRRVEEVNGVIKILRKDK